jgi:hypothetical protein
MLETDDGHWHAIDQNGRTWKVLTGTDDYPALSDDGTRLGHMVPSSSTQGRYQTADLVSGAVTDYPEIGYGYAGAGTGQRYETGPQQPAYWSPDDARLVLRGGEVGSAAASALLLDDGAVTVIPERGYPVGWASPTNIVWLAYNGSVARVTDREGTVLREVHLAADLDGGSLSQWSGRVSPDGRQLAVLAVPETGRMHLWVFDLDDGSVADGFPHRPGSDQSGPCPLVWNGDQVAIWHLPSAQGGKDIEFSARWGVRQCHTWAAEAFAGPALPGPGLTEWRYWRLWWHWRLALGAIVVLAAGSALLIRWWRRRPVAQEPTVDWWSGDPA